mmetsp:Transcript_66551/g.152620  ORF Transcript_66551/g.152620 Transcript_66551/m.152620 type:complete len:523 (+) Transcript_66551:3-1571(+)
MAGSRPASRASSTGPRPGSRSAGYRTVSRTANVDETLFGAASLAQHAGDRAKDVSIVGKDAVLAKKRPPPARGGYPTGGGQDAACVIGASELNRLRESAKMLSKEEEAAQKARQEAEFLEKAEKAAARKEKIRQLEEQRKKRVAEAPEKARPKVNAFVAGAQKVKDENSDDVKHLNQLMQMSKVVTVRDAQMAEKAVLQAEQEEEEKRLDAMMEIDRLKALRTYEVRERERLEQQRSGSKVIIEQIKDRKAQRDREEDQRDQERAFILRQIEALRAEEAEQHRQKQLAAKRLADEVNAVNSAAMKIKEDKVLADRLEEEKILEYNEAKERREREEEDRKLAAAAAKERETARLRGLQEKAQDKASEMDAMRAKRASADAERAAREKDRKEQERLQAMNSELRDARLRQQAEKEARLSAQAKAERDEFDGIIEAQLKAEEAERKRIENEKALRDKHSKELKAQIQSREEKAYQERRDFLELGNQMKALEAGERARLEGLKAKKIEEMTKAGVPEKHLAKVRRK